MNMYKALRMLFIEHKLITDGSIHRRDVMRAFLVSNSQATKDVAAYAAVAKDGLRYDMSSNKYVRTKTYAMHVDYDAIMPLLKTMQAIPATKPDMDQLAYLKNKELSLIHI